MADAIASIPGNHDYQRNLSFSKAFKIILGGSWTAIAESFFLVSCLVGTTCSCLPTLTLAFMHDIHYSHTCTCISTPTVPQSLILTHLLMSLSSPYHALPHTLILTHSLLSPSHTPSTYTSLGTRLCSRGRNSPKSWRVQRFVFMGQNLWITNLTNTNVCGMVWSRLSCRIRRAIRINVRRLCTV